MEDPNESTVDNQEKDDLDYQEMIDNPALGINMLRNSISDAIGRMMMKESEENSYFGRNRPVRGDSEFLVFKESSKQILVMYHSTLNPENSSQIFTDIMLSKDAGNFTVTYRRGQPLEIDAHGESTLMDADQLKRLKGLIDSVAVVGDQ